MKVLTTEKIKTMGVLANLKGKIYGRLTVIHRAESSKNGHAKWFCRCECGNDTVVFASNLKREHTTSCGCVNDEVITKHAMQGTPEYHTWKGMIQRCANPNASRYKDYGGRGITVCEEWLSFEKFYADMGDRPTGTSLDRIDNNSGYYKDNCRWATQSIQNSNKRRK